MSELPPRIQWMNALLETPNDAAHGGIDAFTRAVAFAIFKHMDTPGYARPGVRTIAAQAGVSHPLVEGRVKALEDAGWLMVTRRRGATNEYLGVIPESSQPRNVRCTPDPTAQPRNRATYVAQSDERETVQPRNDSRKARNVRCTEPENQPTTSSSNAINGQRRRVTREEIWKTMAERELGLQRQGNRTDLPPPGSRREASYLAALRNDFQNQHDARAQKLRDSLPPNDLERWIYALDPRLSEHRWGPAIAAQQLEHERNLAESLARVSAQTDDDRAAGARSLAEARARLSERRADQVPA